MSEKYSTEDMIITLAWSSIDTHKRVAIEGRLRAADKLCEVAKRVQKYFKDDYMLNILDKAIADYEEEK